MEISKAALDWVAGPDTGTSSQTIWAVMAGATLDRWHSRPSDPSDFGRCYRLLLAVPEWRVRLGAMAEALPEWGPLVAIWDELEAMFIQVAGADGRTGWDLAASRRMYDRMKSIDDECMRAGGWDQKAPGAWTRGKSSSVKVGRATFRS